MKKILLISGKQKSGKTTTTSYLSECLTNLGYVPKVFKLADPIYEIQNAAAPVLRRYNLWPTRLDAPDIFSEKDGDFLQIIGTEYGRKRRGEMVWINICRERIAQYLAIDEPGRGWETGSPIGARERIAIIDDARFENEFDAFEDAFRVRLECPEDVRKRRPGVWRENTQHESEIGLDKYVECGKFDLVIPTDGISPAGIAHTIRLEWFDRPRKL